MNYWILNKCIWSSSCLYTQPERLKNVSHLQQSGAPEPEAHPWAFRCEVWCLTRWAPNWSGPYHRSSIKSSLMQKTPLDQSAGEDRKWRTVGTSGLGTSGQADTVEEVGLDWTHPQEASIQHHTPSPDLEPAGEEEERPASQQLEARHWSRAETARDHLDWNGLSSPEQSVRGVGGGGGGRRWPMLYQERWE